MLGYQQPIRGGIGDGEIGDTVAQKLSNFKQ